MVEHYILDEIIIFSPPFSFVVRLSPFGAHEMGVFTYANILLKQTETLNSVADPDPIDRKKINPNISIYKSI